MLPVSAAVAKAMLPVWRRPLAHYPLADALAGGCTRAVVVVNDGENDVTRYLDRLQAAAVEQRAPAVEAWAEIAGLQIGTCSQALGGEYGTAAALAMAGPLCGSEPVVVASADDLLRSTEPVAARLLVALAESGAELVVAGYRMAPDHVGRYGIVYAHDGMLERIEEKPEAVPSSDPLVYISRMAFAPSFWPFVERLEVDPVSGEYRLTDAINAFARQHRVAVVDLSDAEYFDCGSPGGWIAANMAVAGV